MNEDAFGDHMWCHLITSVKGVRWGLLDGFKHLCVNVNPAVHQAVSISC